MKAGASSIVTAHGNDHLGISRDYYYFANNDLCGFMCLRQFLGSVVVLRI
jgi:hypothetical protein